MITSRAIVLSRKKVAESDVIIELLTAEQGKLRVYVNGARHPKSRFASATQPFSEGLFSIFVNRQLSRLSEAQIERPHLDIRNDLNKIFLATYMMELIDLALAEGQVVEGLYDRVSHALSALQSAQNLRLFKLVYDLKIIASIGYQPSLAACCNCGCSSELSGQLSVQGGGVVCERCLTSYRDAVSFSAEDLKLINIILKKPFKTIQQIAISDIILLKLGTWTNRFIEAHVVRRPLKSLKLLGL